MKQRKIVFTNGCFSLLHAGHFNLLSFCNDLAGENGIVIVAIDSNKKIRQDKGEMKSLFSFEERKEQILSLSKYENNVRKSLVHEVHCFDTNEELFKLIERIKPSVIVKGADWKNSYVVGSTFHPVEFFEIDNKISSTKIVERVLSKSI